MKPHHIALTSIWICIMAIGFYYLYSSSSTKQCSAVVGIMCFYDGCDLTLWNRDVVTVPRSKARELRESGANYCW